MGGQTRQKIWSSNNGDRKYTRMERGREYSWRSSLARAAIVVCGLRRGDIHVDHCSELASD